MNSEDIKAVPDQLIFDEFFRRAKCLQYPAKKIVLFGPPGSGKGTQASRITNDLCSCHISTGDLLRKEIRDGTELGTKAKEVMNSGGLVSDDLVLQILKKKIDSPECQKGVIFDGFPRTTVQAKKLDEILAQSNTKIDQVFNFHIDDAVLVDRLAGRRVHEASGRSYHLKYNPPKVEGKDDVTGEPLIQRSDDRADAIATRLQTYHEKTTPVLNYYKDANVLSTLDANQPIQSVWSTISSKIFQQSH